MFNVLLIRSNSKGAETTGRGQQRSKKRKKFKEWRGKE